MVEKRMRTAQEGLAALAVACIAFWAPQDDTGLVMRVLYAAIALVCLFIASVGLELLQEWRHAKSTPKANPFEVKIVKVDLPTAPPGGVFEASCAMAKHLGGFEVTLSSEVRATEHGFQVLTGSMKLRARIRGGSAIGWEEGGPGWLKQRQAWMDAVAAAPRVAQVREADWHQVAQLEPADPPAASLDVGVAVRVEGVQAKPELNGKLGVVVKGDNGAGRFGVRLEGSKDAVSLAAKVLRPLEAFCGDGVSIPCLRSFREQYASLLPGLTVADAITSLVLPLTLSPRCSLAHALSRRKATDESGAPLTAAATVFFVYSDKMLLADLLEAVEAYAAEQEELGGVYVWLSLFCSNFHRAAELPLLWHLSTFKAGLKAIGATCMLAAPWDEPLPLKRSWCLLAMQLSLSVGNKVSFALTAKEGAALDEALLADMENVLKKLEAGGASGWRKAAETSVEAHKALVDQAIARHEGGWDELFSKLLELLHRWVLSRAKELLQGLDDAARKSSSMVDHIAKLLQDFGQFEEAEPLCREVVEARKERLGANHADTIEAVNNHAMLLHQLGKLEDAEPLSKAKLDSCRRTLGDRHPDTITAIDTHSQLLSDLGKLDEALPLKRESLAEKRRTLGNKHPDTLLSVNNLAVLLNDLGRSTGNTRMLREAEPLKREALAGCREVLGNRHPHTLASISNLADMLMQLAPADPRALLEAEPLCREALAGAREVFGDGHPDTLKSVGMLAALLVEQAHHAKPESLVRKKKLEECEPLYREAVGGFAQLCGKYHPTTNSYVNEHARVLLDMGRAAEAEAEMKELLSGVRTALGDSHPETLMTITHLAGLLRAQGNLAGAEPLAREVLATWRELEKGSRVQRNTMTSINILAELLHSQGKDREAEPLCREVLGGFEGCFGPEHPFTVSAAENLSAVLLKMGRTDEADIVHRMYKLKRPLGGVAEEGA
ncbi:hypothetical protein AB1Y20_016335 [Prymnesium parvum]|uniref:Kinesin light chain n=1 Tax=Prymnesium parvum TaxID=97485 RepID=A0AB34IDV8_PRYPA